VRTAFEAAALAEVPAAEAVLPAADEALQEQRAAQAAAVVPAAEHAALAAVGAAPVAADESAEGSHSIGQP